MLDTQQTKKTTGKKQTKVLSQKFHSLVREINFKETNKYIIKCTMSDREESSEENQIRLDGYRKQKRHSRENSQERHWLRGPETWRGLREKEGQVMRLSGERIYRQTGESGGDYKVSEIETCWVFVE